MIETLYQNPLLTVTLFDGDINAKVFHTWTVHELLPKLPEHAVVVMDRFPQMSANSAHFASGGHTLEYLPTYSPVLNPIEHK